MSFIDTTRIRLFHQDRSEEFGTDSVQALGWVNNTSQLTRFAMLENIGDMNNHSVLDLGCGHGDLREYLNRKYPRMVYAGIELSEDFLDVATKKYGHLPQTTFYLGDCFASVLPGVDYVLTSGALNYDNGDEDFIYKMINKFFSASKIAFGFNLPSKVDVTGGILKAQNADDIVRYCQLLTNNVVLHDAYLDGDFTIWMYH